ncbi:biosynthetic-type acetolactate synthase large subunit [Christensenellaceae bacterium OttesenSCG-928-K19]|nr:biosynthetic-type acetolactate synthase large subunit [Christensenellaceae bacterium OttesenSCG-928-K19]
MKLTGAQIIMECLKEQGADTVFGFPGGTALPIYDALYEYRHEIRHILTAHEQHAAHAADGYARATGKAGVVFSTSGPGATNLVTGIATAYMDSVPVVAITANVEMKNLGKDSFQEIDITGVTAPITKHNMIVKKISHLADAVRQAFYIANSGRKGPVLIDVPKDITMEQCEYAPATPLPISHKNAFSASDILAAAQAINESKRPFLYIGGGVIASDAEEEVFALAKKIGAPVTTTLMGIGAFPQNDERYTGMIGMHGTKTSALCATHCDLLIAIGARFSERVTSDHAKFAKQAKVLHIDVDPAEINKNIQAHYEITGNAKDVLDTLTPKVKTKKENEWMQQVQTWKKRYPVDRAGKNAQYPKKILQTMQEFAPNDAVFTTEVGQHQMWAAQFLKIDRPRQFITSGGLGTMGFGFGAAEGAAIGTDRRVVNIAGDGSFHMNLQEIVTAVKYNIPVTILILNNQVLGMVRQWQKLFYDERYCNTTLNNPTDYVKLAEAFGAKGFHIADKTELRQKMEEAFRQDGPVIIACDINEDENVLPMVPGGRGLDEIIMEVNK